MAEFPITLAALVARVRRMMEDTPETDALGADLTSSGTTLTVNTPRLFGKGATLEIGNETLYTTTDVSGFTTTVRRGFKFTTASAHTTGDLIYINPRYERANIIEAINVVVGDWITFYAPQLVWDTTTGGSFQPSRLIYPAPTDAINVLRVAWKTPGIVELNDVQHGPLEPFDTTLIPSGTGVQVAEPGMYGQTVRMLVEKPWPLMTADSDSVPSDFPAGMDYLITDGAVLYMLGWRLTPRFRMDEALFSRETQEAVPPNFSMGALQLMQTNWTRGVHRMANLRAQPTKPRSVIRDS